MKPDDDRSAAARLVLDARWAALATTDRGAPMASMVAYAAEPDLGALFLFLSGLSRHTRNLLEDPRTSLVISEPDPGTGDPQTLARMTLQGEARVVPREDPGFAACWQRYVTRFPDAAPRVQLGDFMLFRFVPEKGRFVGGFARARSLTADALREAARATGA